MDDPFVSGTPAVAPQQRESHRYSSFDTQLLSLNASSPSQVKRALEAHLAETERRLQGASQLGTTLVEQQRELSEKLQEVEKQQEEGEIGPDLRQKLADLEKEYNEIGRDAARASLGPKSRTMASDDQGQATPGLDSRFPASPSVLSSQATNSPSKVSVPSRKQRNQPSSRVHDIEFATEISTSLLAQVRQLQALLAEREQSLKDVNLEKSRLELEAEGFTQRLRALDESEQRYKDENWSLETQTHELQAAAREASIKEDRLTSNLNALSSEKNKMQRELDELRQANGRLTEDNAAAQKSHDSEIHILRRNATLAESDRTNLQQKVDELTNQNQELAKAIASKPRVPQLGPAWDTNTHDVDDEEDDQTPESSPPASPTKQTPRHNHLESETLKSSLHHAHRMIQNLKNNIHREKTEKLELKRMLQDARDEVEQRRGDPASGQPKRQKTKPDNSKKPARPEKLGDFRREVTTVESDEPDWEDQTGEISPSRSRTGRALNFAGPGARPESATASDAYHTATEAEEAFETATERDVPTESEAFQTGHESAGDSTDELTETEGTTSGMGTLRRKRPSTSSMAKARDRSSFMSTASTSAEEGDSNNTVSTPVQSHPVRYRLKMHRNRGGGHASSRSFDSTGQESPRFSPASFNSPPQRNVSEGQSLFAELGELASGGESEFGTPGPDSQVTSPVVQRDIDSPQALDVTPTRQVSMIDSAMMTEPWEPKVAPEPVSAGTQSEVPPTGSTAAGTLTDSGTQCTPTKISSSPTKGDSVVMLDTPPKMAWDESDKERPDTADSAVQPATGFAPPEPLELQLSPIFSEATAPRSRSNDAAQLAVSAITSETTTPVPPAISAPTLTTSSVQTVSSEPSLPTAPAPVPVPAPTPATTQPLEISPLLSEETRPIVASISRPSPTVAHTQTDDLRQTSRDIGVGSTINGTPAPTPSAENAVQTILTGTQIDQLLMQRPPSRPKSPAAAVGEFQTSPSATPKAKPQTVSSKDDMRGKRPGSAGSQGRNSISHPPLPADHKQTIAAASQKQSSDASPGVMGPPIAPASAYRATTQNRPRTPSESAGAKGGTARTRTTRYPSQASRQSSLSSFASLIDERFGPDRPDYAFDPGTDPRMIQAITQTMIGEFLWKYTRKTGRPEMSNTRHRRYFWVHPYTRTLYWSTQDPQSANKTQHKSKSVAIEAVRVVTDDNPYPPGLHRKSLEIVTPARTVRFTAATSQRHETWYNALSYLLLRTGEGEGEDDQGAGTDGVGEFTPYSNPSQRADSRMSVSSRNSRNAHTISKNYVQGQGTVRPRRPGTPSMESPTLSNTAHDPTFREGSVSRLSNLFRKSPVVGTFSGRRSRQDPTRMSVESTSQNSNDSAEDVRRVMERQDLEADRLENVRACCDGKHDVSSLSRNGRYKSRNSHYGRVHA